MEATVDLKMKQLDLVPVSCSFSSMASILESRMTEAGLKKARLAGLKKARLNLIELQRLQVEVAVGVRRSCESPLP